MKGAVLSAWIAAGLVLAGSEARAQQTECDLVCRLQGYLATDHMAAAPAPTSPEAPVKHHRHAKVAAPKASQKDAAEPAVAAKPAAKAAAKAPASTLAAADHVLSPAPVPPKQAAGAKAEHGPQPEHAPDKSHAATRDPASDKPPKRHLVAAIALQPEDSAGPASAVPTPRRRQRARAATRSDRNRASGPMASADLIPGSARLVPARFETFGKL